MIRAPEPQGKGMRRIEAPDPGTPPSVDDHEEGGGLDHIDEVDRVHTPPGRRALGRKIGDLVQHG